MSVFLLYCYQLLVFVCVCVSCIRCSVCVCVNVCECVSVSANVGVYLSKCVYVLDHAVWRGGLCLGFIFHTLLSGGDKPSLSEVIANWFCSVLQWADINQACCQRGCFMFVVKVCQQLIGKKLVWLPPLPPIPPLYPNLCIYLCIDLIHSFIHFIYFLYVWFVTSEWGPVFAGAQRLLTEALLKWLFQALSRTHT